MSKKILNSKTLAFTFIEISIVLLVTSIILGLILSGSNLLKTSQYRKIIADFNYYFISARNFQSRYNFLPGDMIGTTNYWGSSTSDGNNDGKIGKGDDSDSIGESTLAWQHLGLSGIIDLNYTGISAGIPVYKKLINTPTTPIDIGFYSLYYFSSIYNKSQNAISFASGSSIPWSNSILTSKDAYYIDSKADDGSPSSGQIYTIRGKEYANALKCVDSALTSSNTNYIFSDSDISCRLLYWLK